MRFGIVDAAIPSFSQRVVYAHVELLQKLIRMPKRYTELALRLKPGVDAEKWVEERTRAAEAHNAELKGWWDIEPIIRKVGKIWDSVVLVIASLRRSCVAIGGRGWRHRLDRVICP